jgi:hypothetical protein
MDLSTIWFTVQDLFQPFAPARGPLKLYQFNNYLKMVNSDLLKKHLRMLDNRSSSVTANDEQMALLQKFKRSVSVNSAAPVALPSGFIRHIKDGAYTSANVKVDIVDIDEYRDRMSNSITAPSTTYPIAYLTNDTIVTVPTTIGTYTLWYYGESLTKPNLVLKSEAGINKYDSVNSVGLGWPEYMYPEIVMMMLKYLGISVNDPSVINEKLKEIANVA